MAAGFVLNDEKSVWAPVQSITWLGIVWNFQQGNISITDQRIGKIEKKLADTLTCQVLSTRDLASITGAIISLSPVFGNLTRIMTRHCQITIAAASGWETQFKIFWPSSPRFKGQMVHR